jgi:alpha-L-fucosidase
MRSHPGGHLRLRKGIWVSLLATVILAAVSSRQMRAQSTQSLGEGGNTMGFDMAPETNLAVVNAAVQQIPVKMAPGPVAPSWDSLKQNYKVPDWFNGAKFGIFMHFGVFSVPAHGNEWYEKFMYAGGDDSTLKAMNSHDSFLPWHTEHFGPPDKFGYKDFIPMFKAEKFDADAWAALFKKAGARHDYEPREHGHPLHPARRPAGRQGEGGAV